MGVICGVAGCGPIVQGALDPVGKYGEGLEAFVNGVMS